MFGSSFHSSKDEILHSRINRPCYSQGKPFVNLNDATRFAKFKLAKWALQLSQHDMKFVPQKDIEGQTITVDIQKKKGRKQKGRKKKERNRRNK